MPELASFYITADLAQYALDRLAEIGRVPMRFDHTDAETDTSVLCLRLCGDPLIESLLDHLAIGQFSTGKIDRFQLEPFFGGANSDKISCRMLGFRDRGQFNPALRGKNKKKSLV